jgi:hypothetical protein
LTSIISIILKKLTHLDFLGVFVRFIAAKQGKVDGSTSASCAYIDRVRGRGRVRVRRPTSTTRQRRVRTAYERKTKIRTVSGGVRV